MSDYRSAKQEVSQDLDTLYPDTLLLTLDQTAKIYGYDNPQKAKNALNLPKVHINGRVKYYKGDIAADIAKRRVGNVR